ncbi:MAG: prolyl oligopeptidase family serine peptidase [Planctomycetia bacterium]|nr:prolyl oligopeptidase family serine peptidase [Planctomycetia bacterium]
MAFEVRCGRNRLVVCRAAVSAFAIWIVSAAALSGDPARGEEENESPYQRGSRGREGGGVYKARITPHWLSDDAGLWYRNELPRGASEFIFVDAKSGARGPAFDHGRLAEALTKAGLADVRADRLPLSDLQFEQQAGQITFHAGSMDWRCNLKTYELIKLANRPAAATDRLAPLDARNAPRASTRTGNETSLTFVNKLAGEIELFWLDGEGQRRSYGKVPPGGQHEQHTFEGHVWEIADRDGRTLARFQAAEADSTAEITGDAATTVRRGPPAGGPRTPRDVSPDGKWVAFLKEHNVFVRPVEREGEVQLSRDGAENQAYILAGWSPDSATLTAFRVEPGDDGQVYLVESSPRGGGRARLHQRGYPLPGDKFAAYELNVFEVASANQIKPGVERIDFGFPRIRWSRDGRTFTYEKIDRGHQRFRLIEVEARTGLTRHLIDERTDTFIWTAHTENADVRRITWLEKTDEIVYASERDGWRHLYLVDAATGEVKNKITQGEWVVRGIERIDEERRQVWFRASGMNPDQDPYFIHFYRINFDGTGLVSLTAGDGNHTVQFSPDRQFLIDTYSRADAPPAHVLRRTIDGSQVCELERADISELESRGWQAPEVFVAKGRDGTTEIWGIICRPRDFDPAKTYPVIESIYAGPQGSYVPKSFSSERRFASLADMGCIVVQIDGMGTANRSKAFHDLCWKNLKDAGLPDRILWHQAVARKYPYYDISRVGIYGTSAGGQNATGAVLFHPEFYKVAVSACGCHDNRMDKASWNEQWMGYPVGKQYAECSNIDNAHRLKGKLMLIVGEMDTNVPPESTLRLADALIRANKDFELVVVPGAGHGMGGAFGTRKMHSFLAKHLLGTETPDRSSKPPDPGVSQNNGGPERVAQGAPSVAAPPEEFFEKVRERDRKAARAFYAKFIDVQGLPVVAGAMVESAALVRTHEIVSRMLAGRPDIMQAMVDNGTRLIIIGKDQVYTDMPEYRNSPNPAYLNERVRGTGGFDVTSFGEENLLNLPLDRYDDESIAVHEFCHTIDAALSRIDPTWRERLGKVYRNAIGSGRWKNAYAASNPAEYWAEICQSYFDCNRVNNWNHAAIGTREELEAYDPEGFELVKSTFRLSAENDWRFKPVRRQPSVIAPPERFKIDPYYTKFTLAREFPVLGSRLASDDALLNANDTIRKMFAYRHDLLKALIADGARLVVLGRDEKLTDLPEFRTAVDKTPGAVQRYVEYSAVRKMIVVPEENILGLAGDAFTGKSLVVGLFARAFHQVAGQRPVDPDFDKRRDKQQYELRVRRLDVEFDRRLEKLFAGAIGKGLWKGTPAGQSPGDYLSAGVEAYFDAAGNAPAPELAPRSITTREALAAYDPELFALVEETMAYKDHADWRYRR